MRTENDDHVGPNGSAVRARHDAVRAGKPRRRAAEKSGSTDKDEADAARATTSRLATTMADAGLVQARLLRAIDRQVLLVDAGLTGSEAVLDERDARILGHLAKTLGTLMEIGEGGKTSKDREPPDRDDAEDRLAERIKKWARGGE